MELTLLAKCGARVEIKNNGHLHEVISQLSAAGSIGNANNLFSIIKITLENFDVHAMQRLLSIGLRKVFLRSDTGAQRIELSANIQRHLFGAELEGFEMIFTGRRFSFGKSMLPHLFLVDEIFIRNQYDVSEKSVKGKVVIDAGANVGFFSLLCAHLGAKRVYAFEPVAGTFEMLQKNIRENGFEGVIVPVNMALGTQNSSAYIRFVAPGDAGAAIYSDVQRPQKQEVSISSIDIFLEGEQADFIKIDTEGCEEDILLGAKRTIAAHKPVLSFSAYHKPSDKVRLPKTVLGIRSDYQIRLNAFSEEVFYCH